MVGSIVNSSGFQRIRPTLRAIRELVGAASQQELASQQGTALRRPRGDLTGWR
jgi:hypothetical protein